MLVSSQLWNPEGRGRVEKYQWRYWLRTPQMKEKMRSGESYKQDKPQ